MGTKHCSAPKVFQHIKGKERATDLSVKGEAEQAPYFPCQTAEKKKAGPLGARFLDR
jgi:hypothetical protein